MAELRGGHRGYGASRQTRIGANEEAAQVDGASAVQTLRYIALPLAIPGVMVSAMFSFLGAWSTFLVPYILLETPAKLPFAITIYQFEGACGACYTGR